MRMNPYHKRMEWLWRLAGLEASKLDRLQTVAEALCCVCGIAAIGAGTFALMAFLAEIVFVLSGQENEMASVTRLLGFAVGSVALGWASWKLNALEESLDKINPYSWSHSEKMSEMRELAERGAAAREWKEDAAWSGRELRMFDYDAMKKIAELETKGELCFTGVARGSAGLPSDESAGASFSFEGSSDSSELSQPKRF